MTDILLYIIVSSHFCEIEILHIEDTEVAVYGSDFLCFVFVFKVFVIFFFYRNFNYREEYFWKSSCLQLCEKQEMKACNKHACPINCLLTEFGPWSDCSPCAQKQATKTQIFYKFFRHI